MEQTKTTHSAEGYTNTAGRKALNGTIDELNEFFAGEIQQL